MLCAESIASLRMGDTTTALERERSRLALCRKTRDLPLVARVLVHRGAISSVLEGASPGKDHGPATKNRAGSRNGDR